MCDTVLFARDKWLRKGGLMFPDKATLYVCAIEDGDYKNEKINFWDSVYGFDMTCIKKIALLEPLVDTVEGDAICTDTYALLSIDIGTVTKEELAFNAEFKLSAVRNDFIHALVVYFDIEFSCCHKKIAFSTGPRARYTHWKQTVFYLKDELTVCEGDVLTGRITSTPNAKNPRDLDINIEYNFVGESMSAAHAQLYRLR
jgi:protein arginine N-methyltransferase 1